MPLFFDRRPAKDIWVEHGGIRVPAQRLWIDRQFAHQREVPALIPHGATSIVLQNHFEAADWANPILLKRAIIQPGFEVGATNPIHAIATTYTDGGQAGSFAGELILDIYGTVSGIGGAPNSGKGGDVIWGNFPGRAGQKLIINNYGLLRPGGGGGGRAGNGGPGVWYSARNYTYTEGPTYVNSYTYAAQLGGGKYDWFWDGIRVVSNQASPVTYGEWTYSIGTYNGSAYSVSRSQTRTAYDVPNYTAGGLAGNAGRGQGYDGFSNSGAAPVAGGTNAGASGKSGDGGGWGASGQAGATGGAGNNGAGLAGAAGGLPGFYLNGSANVQFNNFGTVQGRLQ